MNATPDQPASRADAGSRRTPAWVNWVLALLTVPGAVVVMVFTLDEVMDTVSCTNQTCAHQGPSPFWFDALFYGAPAVAVLTLAISFFTARRKRGIVVPLCGLALLVADMAILAVSFRH